MFHTLTAIDIAALRKGDHLIVRHRHDVAAEYASEIEVVKKAKPSANDPFASDVRHRIPAPTTIFSGHFNSHEDRERAHAVEIVWLYDQSECHSSSILRKILRAGDRVRFAFHADAHTNGYLAARGLHGDALYITVERGEGKSYQRMQLELTTSICPNNSARMVQGLAETDEYRRMGSSRAAAE